MGLMEKPEPRYFLGKNGRIYKDYELTESLYIKTGIRFIPDEIVLHKLKGIEKEIPQPTVEDYINSGQIVDAIRVYRDSNNVDLRVARDEVYKLRDKMEKE